MGLSGHGMPLLSGRRFGRHQPRYRGSRSIGGLPVAPEFYLIIFLMVAMLVYSYFYSERAQNRRAASKQPKTEEATSETFEA
jgi:hypothetical protein